MRGILAACLLALVSGGGSLAAETAAEEPCLPLSVGDPDGNYIVPGARGAIVYRRIGGDALRLDAWAPPPAGASGADTANRAVPLVIIIHGGGFTSGSRVAFVGQFLEMLASAGYAWASIDYRLGGPSRVAEAEDDVRTAVAFTRCHARALGIDRDRIVLLGEDAGAELAARALSAGTPGVMGAALIGGRYTGLAPAPVPSPTEAPPVPLLVVHGTADAESPVGLAEAWCSESRRAGRSCELVRVEGASHRPENWWPAQWEYKTRLVAWLRALAPTPVDPAPAWLTPGLSKPLAPGLYKRIPYARDAASAAADGQPASDILQRTSGGGPPVLRTFDAWLPRGRPHLAPAVVLLHGGGWEAGDRVTYITPLFEPLARAGLTWFSVDYRLTPAVRHPGQLDDVRAAVAFIREHADTFGVDPRRLVLVGESASGQMAAMLAGEDRMLAGVVSFYGVYDFLPMVGDAGPRSLAHRLFGRTVLDDDTRATLRTYSPVHRVGKDAVPMLLVHGTNERLWDQGVAMAARLRELGVAHELVRLDGAPHGMENWEGRPEWQFYKGRLVSWLRERFAARGPG